MMITTIDQDVVEVEVEEEVEDVVVAVVVAVEWEKCTEKTKGSPDGRHIFYGRHGEGKKSVWKIQNRRLHK